MNAMLNTKFKYFSFALSALILFSSAPAGADVGVNPFQVPQGAGAQTTTPTLNVQLGAGWTVYNAPDPAPNRKVVFYSINEKTPQSEELNTLQLTMNGANNYDDVVRLLYNPARSDLATQGCQVVDMGPTPVAGAAPIAKFGYFLQCASKKYSGFDLYMFGSPNVIYYFSYRVHGYPSSLAQQQEMQTVLGAIQVCVRPGQCFSGLN
jgi:hypothetical protein